MVIKLSYPSKMRVNGEKVGTFDLNAGASCPGSKENGEVVEVCKSCYAKKNMYNFPVVKNKRIRNQQDYKRDGWVEDMVKAIGTSKRFRWFSSGDIETPELALKIKSVIAKTPNTIHWLPTRSFKLPKIDQILRRTLPSTQGTYVDYIDDYNNVSLRLSADNIGFKKERPGVNAFVIKPTDLFEAKKRGVYVCPVSLPGSTQKSCDTCTYCYGSGDVAYVLH